MRRHRRRHRRPRLRPNDRIWTILCYLSPRLKTAGLLLDKVNVDDISGSAEVWEKVARKVRMGQMPSAGVPRPDEVSTKEFASVLEARLDRFAAEHPNPGRVAIHRLNRTEYVNSVRDLLGVEVDPRSILMPDGLDQNGFDNIAGALSVFGIAGGLHLFRRKISRPAVGDTHTIPLFETYTVPSSLAQEPRMSEDLPFGSRGGILRFVAAFRLMGSIW